MIYDYYLEIGQLIVTKSNQKPVSEYLSGENSENEIEAGNTATLNPLFVRIKSVFRGVALLSVQTGHFNAMLTNESQSVALPSVIQC